MPVLSVQKLIQNRVAAIRDYHQQAKVDLAELDVSGGIDSAVMCGLLAKAVPKRGSCIASGQSCSRAEWCGTYRSSTLEMSSTFEKYESTGCFELEHEAI